jgi:hypothetical protein
MIPGTTPSSLLATSSSAPHTASARKPSPTSTMRFDVATGYALSSWRNTMRWCADGAIAHTAESDTQLSPRLRSQTLVAGLVARLRGRSPAGIPRRI